MLESCKGSLAAYIHFYLCATLKRDRDCKGNATSSWVCVGVRVVESGKLQFKAVCKHKASEFLAPSSATADRPRAAAGGSGYSASVVPIEEESC